MNYLCVFLGGGVGALCRYLSGEFIKLHFGAAFPWGTLFVNTLGSLAIGFVLGMLTPMVKTAPTEAETLRLLLTVGFLGGFTTFSSFSMETLTLIRGDCLGLAVANVLTNLVLGLGAVWGGVLLAKAMS